MNMDFRGRHRAVYVISVAAELAGVHPQTLRIYERKGLVDPARTGGGSRRYSDADIERLRKIQMLTGAGLNLEGVKRVLALEEQVERLETEVDRLRDELSRRSAPLVPLRQEIVVYRDRD
jgi:MerR family transcriptional regulator/heat shock protein HspR